MENRRLSGTPHNTRLAAFAVLSALITVYIKHVA